MPNKPKRMMEHKNIPTKLHSSRQMKGRPTYGIITITCVNYIT